MVQEMRSRLQSVLRLQRPRFMRMSTWLPLRTQSMSPLQDSLPPFPTEVAKDIVRETLGASVDRLFTTFGPPVACAVVTFVACHNLIFNWGGFVEHVRLIVGPASAYYAVFDNTPAGHAAMAGRALAQIPWVMGWPAALAAYRWG